VSHEYNHTIFFELKFSDIKRCIYLLKRCIYVDDEKLDLASFMEAIQCAILQSAMRGRALPLVADCFF